ncbi:SirB2 family protein [Rhodanobacter sp. AS-Z3]|uniref:SirB2 family protein n=1 Tax=Rhodanobacter sp. AS-Z3 TaxID=3031330 RepID=UPI00247A0B83|nr:SirB2 family protein [Rhodanobacter sp. AS-Z3]WEN14513.1 SirB2 family protein [Rhodanobacter sp. AS-Z3]
MLEFYPQIKWVHIICVLASGSLFAMRGLLTQFGYTNAAQWMPLRWLSYAIDTSLLTAALMLVSILPSALFANGWLTTKLVLLVFYVVFATLALKRARTPRARRGFLIAALATFIYMLGVARMHHPLGWLHGWIA